MSHLTSHQIPSIEKKLMLHGIFYLPLFAQCPPCFSAKSRELLSFVHSYPSALGLNDSGIFQLLKGVLF